MMAMMDDGKMADLREHAHAVLIVEDESLIRMEAVDMVEEAGFTVYEAANASEALRVLEEHDNIGVLFTDIDMPGSMNGLELANTVRQRWPHIGLLITSGHVRITLKDIPEKGKFFPKPYRAVEVTKTLQEIQQGDNE